MSRQHTVLYVNQTAQVSGAERSLLTLVRGLPPRFIPVLACPDGELRASAHSAGIATVEIPETAMSFRLHPVHTARGVAWVARTASQLRRAARAVGADLVHANTTRAGLAAALARRLGNPATVVHIRDWVPPGRLPKAVLRSIELGADALVANSRFIASTLPEARSEVRVIHNPVDAFAFQPARIDREEARAAFGLGKDELALALVAQLTPWKGQADAIRILAELKTSFPTARLLLAGSAKFSAPSSRFDNAAFERDLHRLVRELGVEGATLFLGEQADVSRVLRATDLLLAPSWEEAFGRIAVEAGLMRVPVVASNVGGMAEIVRDHVDGRLLPPRDPQLWAATAAELLSRPDVRKAMGARGRERALEEFSAQRHIARICRLYDDVLDTS